MGFVERKPSRGGGGDGETDEGVMLLAAGGKDGVLTAREHRGVVRLDGSDKGEADRLPSMPVEKVENVNGPALVCRLKGVHMRLAASADFTALEPAVQCIWMQLLHSAQVAILYRCVMMWLAACSDSPPWWPLMTHIRGRWSAVKSHGCRQRRKSCGVLGKVIAALAFPGLAAANTDDCSDVESGFRNLGFALLGFVTCAGLTWFWNRISTYCGSRGWCIWGQNGQNGQPMPYSFHFNGTIIRV